MSSLILNISDQFSKAKEGESGFDYNNPNKDWPDKFKTCGGSRQSPIDIDPSYLRNAYLPPLEFLGYNHHPLSLKIENNGHSGKFLFSNRILLLTELQQIFQNSIFFSKIFS